MKYVNKPPFPTKSVMIKAKLQNDKLVLAEKTWTGYNRIKAKQSVNDLYER